MGLERFGGSRLSEGQQVGKKFRDLRRSDRYGVVVALSDAATEVEDRWIVSRLERLTEEVARLYDGFRFSRHETSR